jgi:hypothetical protein
LGALEKGSSYSQIIQGCFRGGRKALALIMLCALESSLSGVNMHVPRKGIFPQKVKTMGIILKGRLVCMVTKPGDKSCGRREARVCLFPWGDV